MAKVKDVRKTLKQLDPDSHIAVWFITKDELEALMEVSMTNEVWMLAVKAWKASQEDTMVATLRQACWNAEYDMEGEEVHA